MKNSVNLYHADCLELLKTLPDNSIDSCVTDPPYGIRFMSQKWDYDVPESLVWAEVLRVLKPGSYLLAFFSARTYHRGAIRVEDAGFDIVNSIYWLYGSGFPKNANTQLKPAHEPIVMAQKPFTGSAKANVAKWGTGYLNIDGCRVSMEDGDTKGEYGPRPAGVPETTSRNAFGSWNEQVDADNSIGRWPANVLHDGSEEILDEFAKYGDRGALCPTKNRSNEKEPDQATDLLVTKRSGTQVYDYGRGTAARFFYAAKASPSDRGKYNTHPTVKPTSLMRYLCRLVTPKSGIILDNYMGSGSTGKAALLEGFNFIGIEKELDSFNIAQHRIVEAQNKTAGQIQFE